MTKKELFNYYYSQMSDEFREEIKGYEDFKLDNVSTSIKVTFKNGSWIRAYQKDNGIIEWY